MLFNILHNTENSVGVRNYPSAHALHKLGDWSMDLSLETVDRLNFFTDYTTDDATF